jgi:hypothetical protein
MAPVTEILIAKLKDSAESLEGSGEGASIWQETIDTIIVQDGVQRLYWGKVVEDASMVRMFIDWETFEHHKSFEASDTYHPFVEKFMSICSEVVLMSHSEIIPLDKTVRDVFTSPATELLSVFFPAEYTAVQQDKYKEGIQQLIKSIEGKAKGARAAAIGWAIEDNLPNLQKPELKGRIFFLFIGWDSVEDHLEFRGTDIFKENIHYVRQVEGMQGLLNMHFHGKEVVRK